MKVFLGFDPRLPIAFQVASHSIWRRSSRPVSIHPLVLDQLPLSRRGLTEFTFTRFLVPYLCGFKGWALWADSDIVCTADIQRLTKLADPEMAVMAVDTDPFYERSAVMLFNCAHPDNAVLTPDFIETAEKLHLLSWTENVGVLPGDFNFLVGYDQAEPQIDNGEAPKLPSLIHYTKGIPVWPETAGCDYAEVWHAERRAMCGATPTWGEFMGASVHKVAAE